MRDTLLLAVALPRPPACRRRPWARLPAAVAAALLGAILAAVPAAAVPTLDSVSPERQRVWDMITLRGSGFGAFAPGTSKVVFATPDGAVRVEAGRPYVWRDDFIKVRVPAGGGGQSIPRTELTVAVEGVTGSSSPLPFQLLTRATPALAFLERTRIVADEDVSGFLGDVDNNKARTKDGEIGDANGDGLPDLIDNNSNNVNNGTHSVLRVNQGGGAGFADFDWEPVSASDPGSYVVTIPPGGNYVGNVIVYDADFIDLNNDELPDWVEAEAGSALRLRVAMNNHLGIPGRFLEATNTWLPGQVAPGSPDDICHTDINYDGFVDVITSYRFSAAMDLYLNQAGQTFSPKVRITAVGSASIHDVFFVDANADGFADVVGVNENAGSQIFLNNGALPVPGFTHNQTLADDAHSGVAGDFNADGFEDFALSEQNRAEVYLNSPTSPGSFTRFALPDPRDFVYDLEPGDVDLDGDLDLIGAAVILDGNANNAARVWINGGDGRTWTTWSRAGDILPGIGPYQRLSADLVDFDLDGDLDLYLTGSDGDGPWGFGASPNQFWENRTVGMQLGIAGSCPGPGTVRITAASPGSAIAVFGSPTPGSTPLAGGPCAGAVIDLANPQLLAVAAVDANGELEVTPTFPAAACDLFIQVIEQAECAVSNLVPVP